MDFLIAKKVNFFGICKLGEYMVDIHSQYAEPSIDEVRQILLCWHYVLKNYAKNVIRGHPLVRAHS